MPFVRYSDEGCKGDRRECEFLLRRSSRREQFILDANISGSQRPRITTKRKRNKGKERSTHSNEPSSASSSSSASLNAFSSTLLSFYIHEYIISIATSHAEGIECTHVCRQESNSQEALYSTLASDEGQKVLYSWTFLTTHVRL